jgi:hypothetical protein
MIHTEAWGGCFNSSFGTSDSVLDAGLCDSGNSCRLNSKPVDGLWMISEFAAVSLKSTIVFTELILNLPFVLEVCSGPIDVMV